MSSDSNSVPSSPPTQFQEYVESQWIQQTAYNGQNNGSHAQWTDCPPLEMIPLPVEASSLVNAGYNGPTLNQQKYFPSNNANNMNNFNTPNLVERELRMRGPSGNSLNGMRPMLPNGVVPNSASGWIIPNTARLVTRPICNTVTKTSTVRKPKRIRTAFTSQQMMQLEQEYVKARYLDRTRRIDLAEELHLNERTIKIWFQNRRMKEKKDKAESFEEYGVCEEASSTTDSSPEIKMAMQDQPNDVFSGNQYVEQYLPPTTTSNIMPVSVPMPQFVQNPNGNVYASALIAKEYDDLQMHHYPPPPYSDERQSNANESPPGLEEVELIPPENRNADQDWDMSWIRMQISDDC